MRRIIHQRPASELSLASPSGLRRTGHDRAIGLAEDVTDPSRSSGGDEPLQFAEAGDEAIVIPHLSDDAPLLGQLCQLAADLWIQCQRLLAEDVEASRNRFPRDLLVRSGRRRDDDRVELIELQGVRGAGHMANAGDLAQRRADKRR